MKFYNKKQAPGSKRDCMQCRRCKIKYGNLPIKNSQKVGPGLPQIIKKQKGLRHQLLYFLILIKSVLIIWNNI